MKIERELILADLSISLPDVYQAMGCDAAFVDETLATETQQLLQQLKTILRPRFLCFQIDGALDVANEQLLIDHESFAIGKVISRQLRHSESFLFFVAKAGTEFEEWQHTPEIKNDLLKSYITDSLGSLIAEKTADVMELEVAKCIEEKGWKHTNRYSPGYCGWHVSEQHKLFSLFPEPYPCGIHLTDSSLMIPIKSVSGVIGLGSQVRKLEDTCGLC